MNVAQRPARHLRSALWILIHLYYRLYLRVKGVSWGQVWYFSGRPIVRVTPGSTIQASRRLVLLSRTAALGINHLVVLTTLRPESFLRIGDNTGVTIGVGGLGAASSVGPVNLKGVEWNGI